MTWASSIEEGNYEESSIAFKGAIEIDPSRAEAYEKLADVYVVMDDIESAVEILRQGAEAVGDNTFFQSRINELTVEVGSSSESTSGSAQHDTTQSKPRVERVNRPDGEYWLYYYDEAGNRTREESYLPDDTLLSIDYFDVAGKRTRQEWYEPDGTLREYWLYYYDAAGNLTQTEIYEPDGTLTRKDTYN